MMDRCIGDWVCEEVVKNGLEDVFIKGWKEKIRIRVPGTGEWEWRLS